MQRCLRKGAGGGAPSIMSLEDIRTQACWAFLGCSFQKHEDLKHQPLGIDLYINAGEYHSWFTLESDLINTNCCIPCHWCVKLQIFTSIQKSEDWCWKLISPNHVICNLGDQPLFHLVSRPLHSYDKEHLYFSYPWGNSKSVRHCELGTKDKEQIQMNNRFRRSK